MQHPVLLKTSSDKMVEALGVLDRAVKQGQKLGLRGTGRNVKDELVDELGWTESDARKIAEALNAKGHIEQQVSGGRRWYRVSPSGGILVANHGTDFDDDDSLSL